MATLFLDPGMLNTRLDLEESVEAEDGQGGAARDWAYVTGLWGRIEPVSALSAEIAAGLRQRVTHRVTIRHREAVRQQMRFLRLGRAFSIRTVHDPDESGRYLVCLCEETTL